MITFNNFYRFVTGLKNSRFIYQEAQKPEPPKSEAGEKLEETADKAADTIEDVNKAEAKYIKEMKDKGKKLAEQKKAESLKNALSILKSIPDSKSPFTPEQKKEKGKS